MPLTPSELLAVVGPALTLPLHARVAGRAWRERKRVTSPRHVVPVLLGLAVLSFVVGQCISAYDHHVVHQAARFPSWADAGYLGAYPFLVLGAILLAAHVVPWASRTGVVLDSLMTVAAAAPFSWYFILGPAIVRKGPITLGVMGEVGYSLCALSLLFVVSLLVSAAVGTPALRRLALALVPGLLIIALGDSVYAYQALHYVTGLDPLLNMSRALGYILLGLAGSVGCSALTSGLDAVELSADRAFASPAPIGRQRVWRYLLPYGLIAAVVILIASLSHAPSQRGVAPGVYITAALLLELIVVQQVLAYRDLIALANRSARLESLASADPITGLPNHRSLATALSHELGRAHRSGRPCTLLFLDLDHFKALNDSFGHRAGDAALREFASVVRAVLRTTDVLGRWGGEEFIVILPETDRDAGMAVAERLRTEVAGHAFWAAGGSHLTCSLGMATYPQDASDRDGLIEMADQAMYAAKRLGRNQVRDASDPAVAAQSDEAHTVGSRHEVALVGTVGALAAMVAARDHYTGEHIEDVAGLGMRLALTLGLDASQAHLVRLAGQLHDIGKVAIPDAVLQKPSRLSDEEWALMQTHAAAGAAIVSRVPALRALAPVIRAHHEWWNGRGYPDGLRGEAIPLPARILTVVDAFSAMTTDRPYRQALGQEAALAELRRCSGIQFDPQVVDALNKVLASEPKVVEGAGVV